ncbi:MAG: A-factor biosynthesis hotdog domain protein [Gammaproteobacteria bacterium]|jgi:hypothetical protein|nr:A-factor biosynthesis hotdog domain protein [Gammaproteobacteria bacterium]
MSNHYLIIGNIFKSLSDQKLVLTLDELIENLNSRTIKHGLLSLQQGISEDEAQYIKNILGSKKLLSTFTLSSYFDEATRCPNKLTHKAHTFNTLISEPHASKDQGYTSLLMIDSRCAEMSDHVTGKHIQMSVLAEAARQMVLAVTEKFFIPESLRGHLSFVANRTESKFTHFVFPFRTEIHCNILKQRILSGNNLLNTIQIQFIQNHETVAEMQFDSSVFSKKFLTEKENRMADIALKKQLKNIPYFPMVANDG